MPVATTEAPLDQARFSAVLRRSTLGVHDRANHSRYMDALLGGALALSGYTQLAVQYHYIYGAIEQASTAMTGDKVGGEFVFEELRRTPSLEADLEFLVGPDWRTTIEPLPATRAYVDRIRSVAFDWAGGYVAHHYTRYLGDIAGGQIIRRLLEKNYRIDGPGSLFYRFDLPMSAPAFRDRYRGLLDTAPWDEAERAKVIDETLAAFECNIAVFDELADGMNEHLAA